MRLHTLVLYSCLIGLCRMVQIAKPSYTMVLYALSWLRGDYRGPTPDRSLNAQVASLPRAWRIYCIGCIVGTMAVDRVVPRYQVHPRLRQSTSTITRG